MLGQKVATDGPLLIMAKKHCMTSKRVARITGKYARYLASKRVKTEQPHKEIAIVRLA